MELLSIKNLEVSKEEFKFGYELSNTFSHDIWICDDIYEYYEIRVETKVEEDTLLIRLRSFDVPVGILLEAPVLAKYICLRSGGVYKGQVLLKLPVASLSPVHLKTRHLEQQAVKELEHVIFELGFFTQDLSKESSDCIQKSDSDDMVYVGHLWDQKGKEQSLKVDITGVRIPCYIPKNK